MNGDPVMEEEAREVVSEFFSLGFRWRKFPVSFARLVRFLRARRFDVLHAHLPLADFLGRLAAKSAGVPVVITTEHGKHLWKSPLYLAAERILNRVTDVRICVSRDIMEIRSRRERTPHEKLRYVPNSVDTSLFGSSSMKRASLMAEFGWGVDDPLVVSVGRLVEAKNYPSLIRAFGIVRRDVPEARCLLVGDGPLRGRLEEEIQSMKLTGNVAIAGTRRDIPDILLSCDVFTLSSIREGLPVSLLEAMAAGCAVAVTRAGGIPDAIVNEVNGLLVDIDDTEALAEAVTRLLSDRELAGRLGERAKRDVQERFSARAVAREVGDIYIDVARRKGVVE